MTLDAGGTNFVFTAIQASKQIIEQITYPAHGEDLTLSLETILKGFEQVQNSLPQKASAISFAFPGPADYPAGIIGDLGNLPAYRGGVALGPMLEEKFGIPVFINNDGDLFTLGEAAAGFLPFLNMKLTEAGSNKKCNNLFGMTIGTGFGGGIVRNGELYIGDNSSAGEVWLLRNYIYPESFAEESVSIRAVAREYRKAAAIGDDLLLSPKDIFEIAMGEKEGNKLAAIKAYEILGTSIGEAMANIITLLDAQVVIGGGIAGAADLFLPKVIETINSTIKTINGDELPRLDLRAYNLENKNDLDEFCKSTPSEINVPFSDKKVLFESEKRIGVGISKLGTAEAVALGAYTFGLNQLEKK
ncbi:MAG: ROK family protein [Bacteroidetes bacterium]|nr:ROK family protein [Bacteroidota bacterium]